MSNLDQIIKKYREPLKTEGESYKVILTKDKPEQAVKHIIEKEDNNENK